MNMKTVLAFIFSVYTTGFISAATSSGWLFDPTTKTLTENNVAEGGTAWIFNCSVSDKSLLLGSVSQTGSDTVLDFCSAISDGNGTSYSITQVGSYIYDPSPAGILQGNESLQEVLLPETVHTIGTRAFKGCKALTKVTPFLPDAVTFIGAAAFNGAPVEGELRIGYGTKLTLSTDVYGGGWHFSGVQVHNFKSGPALHGFTTYFMNQNKQLTNVVIESEQFTSISRDAFSNCSKLAHFKPLLPETLTVLGANAFLATALEGSVRLGFAQSLNLTGDDYQSGNYFKGSKICELILGPQVKSLRNYFAQNCTALTNVVIMSDEFSSIGTYAFSGCTALKTVTPLLPDSLTSIGAWAFANCPVTGTLRIGFGASLGMGTGTYGEGCQFYNTKINEIITGPSVTYFRQKFAQNCTALTNVNLTKSVNLTSIQANTFLNATSLKSVWLNSYPTFGGSAFSGVPATACFRLSSEVDEWTTWLADTANATPWSELTDDAKEVYFGAWGRQGALPKGRAVVNLSPFPKNSWLKRYSPHGYNLLLLR